MADTKVARKYANGLFEAARKAKAERVVWDDLAGLKAVLDKDRQLLRVLASPQLAAEEKQALVRAVTRDAGHEIMRSFLLFLVEKNRTEHLPEMIDVYRHLLDETEGVVEARITSAVTLTDSEVQEMVGRLETLSGKKLRYTTEVDPEILGGVVVILGGQIIDHSVRNDLLRLRDQLRAVKVHEEAA